MNERRSRRHPTWWSLSAATAALAVGLGMVPGTALAAPAPVVAPAPGDHRGDQAEQPVEIEGLDAGTHTVTLVTGDRLRLDGGVDGRFAVSVDHLAARPQGQLTPTIEVTSQDDGVFAIPSDVAPAVSRGRVDRALFDLRYLAEHGLTDEAGGQLPLIVGYERANAFAAAEALPASDATTALESLGGAAVSVPKAQAERFWSAVRGAPGTLSRGIDRIWLDGTAQLTLDVSVPLIGAPKAWESGVDGTGVTVAVLDSGVDADHPDLAGQIIGSRSFIPGETVADTHGHGTHVATTIAGTGAASGGRYKGVAPGAKLLIGKVCQTQGCPNSAIVEGMEWAAAQGADVVSLSLGGAPTDGTDPLSASVNALTEATGALFVIAAGNDGPDDGTVSSPGTADAALTVAATSKTDGMADFSSRGPRLDGALKPDIAAPGVAIVAGRAAGTGMGTPVDDRYTSANGTSMATPHVSGAAALLAQRHPDWRAARLKTALMSTSKDTGHTVYEAGAGRVDVAKAVGHQVFATTGAVDFGNVDPGQTPEPVTKQVTYTNTAAAPVTLTLARTLRQVGGDSVPGGAFTGEDTVTVPAGGSATTSVSLDLAPLAVGRYTGALTATDVASGTSLTTPVAVDRQPPKVELVLRVLDDEGAAPCEMCTVATIVAVDVPEASVVVATQTQPGVYRARVEQGTYSVHAFIELTDSVTSEFARAYLADPEVEVDKRTEVTLDARQAREVTISAPEGTHNYARTVTWARSTLDEGLSTSVTIGGYLWAQARLLATPTERVATGRFHFGVEHLAANQQVAIRVAGRDGFALDLRHRGYSDRGSPMDGEVLDFVPWRATRSRVELVDVGYGTPSDLAGKRLRGTLAVLSWGDDRIGTDDVPESRVWTDRVRALKDAGAIGYLAVSRPPAGWEGNQSFSVPSSFVGSTPEGPAHLELPEAQLTRDQGLELLARLAKGRVFVDLTVDPNVRDTYHLYPNFDGRIPGDLDIEVGRRQLVEIDSAYHGGEAYELRNAFSAYNPGQAFGGGAWVDTAGPAERVDHYGPVNPKVTLMRSKRRASDGLSWRGVNAYDRPGSADERWFVPGVVPGSMDLGAAYRAQDPDDTRSTWYYCAFCREGNVLWPFWTNAYRDGTQSQGVMQAGGVRLYDADGTAIPAKVVSSLPVPAFTLPPESARYRMTMQRPGSQTTWDFRSSTPARDTTLPGGLCVLRHREGGTQPCAQQPLVFLGYDFGRALRLDNTVVAGGRHEFTVFANHGPSAAAMPRIAGARVWTSVDDGVTWQEAKVRRDRDGRFTVAARYPEPAATTGAVSVRTQAWDVHGNRVEQVLDRVVPLAGR